MRTHTTLWVALSAAALVVAVAATGTRPTPTTREPAVDALFAKWTSATPGCAVGVATGGAPVLTKAYGMADLEHDVPNTAETIFEAGSVSKQFTAAAVLLLAQEGKLSLDDPARKYVPDIPDYGTPLTIRHMLTHTSGLRDWGSVEGIAGWPRTTRAYTHAHVLDIVSRQTALNFAPGTRWSYSNTGFNLAAIIVSRVSGQAFADFTRDRLFQPLGMTHTSWRDDHARIVKGRAVAYREDHGAFSTEMPFEDVHGNGGLLTTVGDLLKWNEHYASPSPADAAVVKAQQEIGRFADGRQHDYAFGLWVSDYKGLRNVWHSGSTAGYRAHLNRFPEAHASVAVLCNVSTGEATAAANAVSDLYLADRLKPAAPPGATHTLTASEMDQVAGMYRNAATGEPLSIARDKGALRVEGGAPLVPQSATSFLTATHQIWAFDGHGALRVTDAFGTVDQYEHVDPATPTQSQLQALAGAYRSDDAEATLTVVADADGLAIGRRPDTKIPLTPVYADAFRGSIGLVIFRRSGAEARTLSIVQDRVWDLRFAKVESEKSKGRSR